MWVDSREPDAPTAEAVGRRPMAGTFNTGRLGLPFPSPAGDYTVSVFPFGHRAGDLSVLAEEVTLLTCPPAESWP